MFFNGLIKLCSLLLLFLFLQGCSSTAQKKPTTSTSNKIETAHTSQLTPHEKARYELLLAEYKAWKGTPYRLGGTDKSGVDCSALVQNIYTDSFSAHIPRTTKSQVTRGKKVSRSKLKVADLVFFKTSWKVRHVGIYIGDNKFLHASTSKGVIISQLDNVYWNKSYWQARRILE